jgi:SEC-C motif domain protein
MSQKKIKPNNKDQICPCDTGKKYMQCCGQWHSTEKYMQAPDALALMRSRYSAFVLGLNTYIEDTSCNHQLVNNFELIRWISLEIKEFIFDINIPDKAQVKFIAKFKNNGKAEHMEEHSFFTKGKNGDDKWYYINDTM